MSDTENLNSKDILRNYLEKELFQVITKQQFRSLFNKVARRSVDDSMVNELFALLNQQKNRVINKRIDDNIENLKLVSYYDSKHVVETSKISDDEFSKLVASMMLLDNSLREDITQVESECKNQLKEINRIVDKLQKCKCDSSDNDKSLGKLQKTLESIEGELLK
ncbi:hypothetical protein FOA43_003310 [Brettanomyces nanus]|uniref:Uncharacterized protein n=1 Tax=Eeniella nana TaxID=13502 RepID=A0A875SAA4_EENNA|nr:uncharacterized protein FOA43_003310 [Brettanomyces nanus]QPG75924.1 hypothetical protein FOA43_003310 [Brettanomyces nanus]